MSTKSLTAIDSSLEEPKGGNTMDAESTSRSAATNLSDTSVAFETKLSDDAEDEIDYPEGGWEAWGVVLGSFCAMTVTFGFSNSMGTIQAYLRENQLKDYSDSAVSWIFSIWLFCMFMGSIQVGPLFDTYGTFALVFPGSIFFVLSFFVMAWCTEYYQFMLGFSLLGGLSASLIFNPSVTAIGHWFYRRRALAMSLSFSGGAVGGVMFPLVLNRLFPQVGYAWSMRIVGFMVFFLLIIANLLLKARTLKKEIRFRDALIDLKSFKDMRFVFTVICIFMIEWAFFVPVNYLVVYARTTGRSAAFSNNLLAYLNACSCIGRSVPGYVADKVGPFNMMIAVCSISGIIILTVWLPAGHSDAGAIAFACLFGFFSGSSLPLAPVTIGRISDTREYGRRYGTCYFLCSFATLTGLPISGALIHGNNYTGLIVFGGVVFLVASASAGAARFLAGRHQVYY